MRRRKPQSAKGNSAARGQRSPAEPRHVTEHLEKRVLLAGANDQAIISAITSALLPATSGGFTAFTNRLKDNNILARQLPLVARGIGQNINPKAVFDSVLSRLSAGYTSVVQLRSALEGAAGVADGLEVLATRDLTDNIEFDLRLAAGSNIAVPLSALFGDTDFAISGSVNVQVDFDFRITVGGQWSGSSAFFYVADSNEVLGVSASVSATNINATARLGFLDVQLAGGSISLSPQFSLGLTDVGVSGGSGRITLSELNTGTLSTLINTSVGASASTSLSATVSTSGAVGLPAQNMSFSWSDINDLASVSTNLGSLGNYNLFEQISALTFQQGLEGVSDFSEIFGGLGTFGRPLPGLGTQLQSVLDIPGLITSRTVNVGSFNSLESYITRLNAGSGNSNVSFSLSGTELTIQLNLSATRNTTRAFDLSLADLPLRLDGSSLGVNATVAGRLKFGVDLSTRDFYLYDDASGPEFSATASISASNLSGSGGVGFVSASVAGGQAQLSFNGQLQLDKPGVDRFGVADFAEESSVPGWVDFTFGGSASGSLPIQSSLLGIGSQTFGFTWTDLTDPGTFSSNLPSFSAFGGWSDVDNGDFAGGVETILQGLEIALAAGGLNNPLKKPLPIVGRSIDQLIGTQALLDTIQAAAGYGGTTEAPTVPFLNSDQLLTRLRNIVGAGVSNVSLSFVDQVDNALDALQYTVHIDRTINSSVPFSAGFDAGVLDLNVSGTATVSMNVDIDLQFGVTRSGGFYISTAPADTIRATGNVTLALASSARLGFVDVSIAGATASFGADARLRLIDPATSTPASPGRIVQSEINFANIGALVQTSVNGSASLALPLSVSGIPGLTGGTLGISWPDVLDPSTISINDAAVQKLFDFSNVNIDSALGGLSAIPTILSLLGGSGAFGVDLGFLGESLGTVQTLANRFTTAVNSFGTTTKSAQAFATRLGSVMQSAFGSLVNVVTGYDLPNGVLQYTFTVNETINRSINIGVQEELLGLGFNLGTAATFSGAAGASFTIGLDLNDGVPVNERFFLVPGAATSANVRGRLTGSVNANASLGFFQIGVTGGTALLRGTTGGVLDPNKDATLAVQLRDPNNNDNRITLAEILANPAAALSPTLTDDIALDVTLPISAGLPAGQGATPRIKITSSDLLTNGISVQAFDLNNLIGAENFNFSSIGAGINSVINLLSGLLGNGVMNTNIPLINKPLKDIFGFTQSLTQVWGQLNVSQPTAAAFAALVTSVDNALPNVTITPSSNPALHNPAQSRFQYTLTYNQTFTPAQPIPFDFGSDLFGLDATLLPTIDLTGSIVWGANSDRGFYLDGISELNLDASLNVTIPRFGGDFGFLIIGVKDGTFDIDFNLGIQIDNTANLLGDIDVDVSGDASVVLPLGAYLGEDGPGIKTTFRAYWTAETPTTFYFSPVDPGATPITQLSTDPGVGFGPVLFEMGDFIRGLVGPYVQKFNEFNPFPPEMVEFLNTELPIIGQTPLEAIETIYGADWIEPIRVMLEVADTVNSITALFDEGATLDLSEFFGSNRPGSGGGAGVPSGSGSETGGILAPFVSVLNDLKGYNIELLALDPDNLQGSLFNAALQLFLGKDVDLIRWNPPEFRAGVPFNTPEFLIAAINVGPIVGTITGQIKGEVGFFADLDIGFSSRGIRTGNFLDGFFIGDNITNLGQANQVDPFEVGGYGEVGLFIKGKVSLLGLLGATIEGGGGIIGRIGLDLSDVKYSTTNPPVPQSIVFRDQIGGDNRVYFDDIEAMLQLGYGPECILRLGGSLSAFVEFAVIANILWFDVEVFRTRQEFELFNWDLPCEPMESDVAVVVGNELRLNNVESRYDHDIRYDVVYGDLTDGQAPAPIGIRVNFNQRGGTYERIIDSLGSVGNPTTVDIYGNNLGSGTRARFSGDGRVYTLFTAVPGQAQWFLASEGQSPNTFQVEAIRRFETFTFTNSASANYIGNVNTLVVTGSQGADRVRIAPRVLELFTVPTGSYAITTLRFNGRSGSDEINLSELEENETTLTAVTLEGGSGNDTLIGTFLNDSIIGGDGNDELSGGAGNDTLRGEAGDDKLIAGSGNDSVTGGSGSDFISGTNGGNTLAGEGGNDQILGGVSDDLITGGSGNDSINAGSGIDTVSGDTGNDSIDGGDDNDFLFGNDDNDVVFGGAGNDYIDGGAGSDSMRGDSGFDIVFKSAAGPQTISDSLLVGEGTDSLGSGVERVIIQGSSGNDSFDVTGWTGATLLVRGLSGQDTISSSNDTDFTIRQGTLSRDGSDFSFESVESLALAGGPGANVFDLGDFAGTGTLVGGEGNDRIVASGTGSFTLSNVAFQRSIGTNLSIDSIDEAELTGDNLANSINAAPFTGRTTLSGLAGNDTLVGGSGSDLLLAGLGSDSVTGNGGDDELVGGGSGDTLDGSAGDDLIRGSNNGADSIRGGTGRDYVLGGAGNDTIDGGDGDDTMLGEAGDDLLTGNLGSDILAGGANHDVLYGHTQAGTGDDNAVDFLYGDFATNQNEAGSGRDCIFGGGGNDLMFGEGDDDFISAGAGSSNTVNYGAGEGPDPTTFVAPTPTPPPPAGTASSTHAPATLPIGPVGRDRWGMLSGSASRFGTSGGSGISREPSVVVGTSGTYLAWSDNRTGNFEIYVAHHNGNGWVELGTSASGVGVSASDLSDSIRPSIALDNTGAPVVAWTEQTTSGRKIRLARWDGSSWAALGNSLSVGGISSATNADQAKLVYRGSTPIVAFINEDGTDQANALQFNGSSWVNFGSGTVAHSTASEATDLSLATDGTNVSIAYTLAGDVWVRSSSGAAWSTSGAGSASTSASPASRPSIAYHAGALFVAWEQVVGSDVEVYGARVSGGVWAEAGANSRSAGGLSSTGGSATRPQLASNGGSLHLLWLDDQFAAERGNSTAIFAKRWNGSSFVEELPGDARATGIHARYASPTSLALAVSSTGQPTSAWADLSPGREEVLLRTNAQTLGTIYYVNDSTGFGDFYTTGSGSDSATGTSPSSPLNSIQAVLDEYDLGPNDVILVDTGAYAGFTIASGDAGVRIIGAPASGTLIDGAVTINGNNVSLEGLDITQSLAISGTGVTLHDSTVRGSTTATSATNLEITESDLRGPLTLNSTINASILSNTLRPATGSAILLSGGSITAFDNRIRSGAAGITISGAASGNIRRNDLRAVSTVLAIDAPLTGSIDNNRIAGGALGVRYAARADLSGNIITSNSTGLTTTISVEADALGNVGARVPNLITRNTLGVSLSNARMIRQQVIGNTTGVSGSGTLGSLNIDDANLIERNATIGADVSGTVRFNRIGYNTTGLRLGANSLATHNVIYRNSASGIVVTGANANISSNTVYAQTGDALGIEAASAEVRNNILWSDDGYAMRLSEAARANFFSDYNALLAGPSSDGIVFYAKPFVDLIDWQRDVNEFDLHSVGTTSIDPGRAIPRFYSLGRDDYRVFPQVGGLRASSPTSAAGDPLSDRGTTRTTPNLLSNASFDSNLSGWSTGVGATVKTTSPAPFEGAGYYFGNTAQVAFIEQVVTLTNSGLSTTQLDTADYVALVGGRLRVAAEDISDVARFVFSFRDGLGQPIGSPVSYEPESLPADRWQLDGLRLTIPSGARQLVYRFESEIRSGSTNDAFLDAAFVRVQGDLASFDLGATGQTQLDATDDPQQYRMHVRYPDMYQDIERLRPITVLWDSYGNSAESPVRIDVLQDGVDGPAQRVNITAAAPDTGSFTFTPADFGLNFGERGFRIQVSHVVDPIGMDRSIEASTVPESGQNYYVDDASNAGDQYTPGAVGNNRNTGKLPTAPKPLLTTLLRTYDLGAADTVFMDTGSYGHFRDVRISGNTLINDDEGATITGPTNASVASVFHFNPTTGTLFEFNDGDNTTLANLTLTGSRRGVYTRNDSTGLTLQNLLISGTSLEGVRLESDSVDVIIENVSVSGAGSAGLFSGVRLLELSGGTFANNAGHGVNLALGAALVENNTFTNNTQSGLFINNSPATMLVRGNLSSGNENGIYITIGGSTITLEENRILSNSNIGVYAVGGAVVRRNFISGHTGTNDAGIYLESGSSAVENVLVNNFRGIRSLTNGLISRNRISGSSSIGIYSSTFSGNGSIVGNVIYGGATGIRVESTPSLTIANNLLYGNTSVSILLDGGSSITTIANNTIDAAGADAIRIENGKINNTLRNNIIRTSGSGAGINVASNSQVGFASDYNLLIASGGASVGLWQGVARASLDAWRSATFGDANSISTNPLFYDTNGADNIAGNADDDYHLQSPHGVAAGGSLAPILGPGSLPIDNPGTLITNPANPLSPAIDRGNPSSSFANEPVPNGSIVNLGAFGNTEQASRSPGTYVLVISPNGGESWAQTQTFDIRWNSHDALGTVDVELVRDSDPLNPILVADNTANDGLFAWTIPLSVTPASDYRIRVIRSDAAGADLSDATFEITLPITIYYVNDNSLVGDVFTNVVGDDLNSGTNPNAPKATLQNLLASYDLGPGDVIRVDTGIYNLTGNIVITANDAGVTIEGPSGRIEAGAGYADLVALDAPIYQNRTAGPGGSPGAFAGTTNESTTYTGSNITTIAPIPVGGSTVSFEAWIAPTTLTGTGYIAQTAITNTLGDANPANDVGIVLAGLYRSGNRLGMTVSLVNASNARQNFSFEGGSLLNGAWHHVVGTFDSADPSAIRLYVNGVQVAASGAVPAGHLTIGGGTNTANPRASIGAANATVTSGAIVENNFFAGRIQEVAVYSSELQVTPIRERSNAGSFAQYRAVLDRQNTNTGSYVFDLQNADGVTIRNLQLTGAETAIFASQTADSDDVTLENLSIVANDDYGIWLSNTNDRTTIVNNFVASLFSTSATRLSSWGIAVGGASGVLIADNVVLNHDQDGIAIRNGASNTIVRGNLVDVASGVGIRAEPGGLNTLEDNVISSAITGISANNSTRVIGNTISGSSTGIEATLVSLPIEGNTVSSSSIGIRSNQGTATGPIQFNRVYSTGTGINSSNTEVIGNIVHNNSVGILASSVTGVSRRVRNNLVYASTTAGIRLNAFRSSVENNTVYEPTAIGIDVQAVSANVSLRNNAVAVGTGRAVVVDSTSQIGFSSDYNLFELQTPSASIGTWQGQNFSTIVDWQFDLNLDLESRVVDLELTNPAGLDGQLGIVGGVNYSDDDDFSFASSSPVIDAGSPFSYHLSEPAPSGDRVNVGHLGNTSNANPSAPQTVQVIDPNGAEKLLVGDNFDLGWRSSGFTPTRSVALINASGSQQDLWLFDRYQTVTRSSGSTTSAIDLTQITNPAPQAVYQTHVLNNAAVNTSMDWLLPVPDGTYTLRLHFAEPTLTNSSGRSFDVEVNGLLVADNYNIFSAAGGRFRAVALDIPVSTTSGAGINLRLINQVGQALLSGIEVVQVNPLGSSDPTFDLDLSIDDGQNYASVGTNLSVDRYGRGVFPWTAGPASSAARLRATSVEVPSVSDVSDESFLISAAGNAYYVNDGSLAGDLFTTAVGNNANTGRDPASPMSSISALIARYDLGPGDVIYVDAGTYTLLSNIQLTSREAGVRIEGAGADLTMVDRANIASIAHAFQLINADNITIAAMTIRGAYSGIHANDTSGSTGLTVEDARFVRNDFAGIDVRSTNNNLTVTGSQFIGNDGNPVRHDYGIFASTISNATIRGNEFSNSTTNNLRLFGQFALVEDNISIGAPTGYYISNNTSGGTGFIRNNTATSASTYGFNIEYDLVLEGNTASGVPSASGAGIYTFSNSSVFGSTVFNNAIGIRAENAFGRIENNTGYGNQTGIQLQGGTGVSFVRFNTLYSNNVGISVRNNGGNQNGSRVENNLIYASTTHGIDVQNSNGAHVVNNTIYNPAAKGLLISGSFTTSLRVRNNVIVAGSGFAYEVSADAQRGLSIDYNLVQVLGSAQFAQWQGTVIGSASEWAYRLGFDRNGLAIDPEFLDPDGADNQLGGSPGAAADDNFAHALTSPVVDAGDPRDLFLAEPVQGGGRVNIGHLGNTGAATPSDPSTIQILSPSPREKLTPGATREVRIRASNLIDRQTVARLNMGAFTVGDWMDDERYYTSRGLDVTTTSDINISNIGYEVPASLYQSYQSTTISVDRLAYRFPVVNGNYELTLHFAEPNTTAVGARRFDIYVNGVLAVANYDIRAAAGAIRTAVTLTLPATASAQNGLTLELVHQTSNFPALLSGLEVARITPAGSAPPVDLQFSPDNGSTWQPVASNLVVDRWGEATFDWTVPNQPTSVAQLRASAGLISQTTPANFQIARPGNVYFVNDSSLAGDLLTTAIGNDTNDGKSPDQPMRNLFSLLSYYDFSAGDIVYVDTGSYLELQNLVLTNPDSGLTIVGAGPALTTLDRSNVESARSVFELINADSITVEALGITGAEAGVFVGDASDSDDLTLRNVRVFNNEFNGVIVGTLSDRLRVLDSTFFGTPGGSANDNQNFGIVVNGTNATITGNVVFAHGTRGISFVTATGLINNNEVYNNPSGIVVSGSVGSGVPPLDVIGNTVYNNSTYGIDAQTNVRVMNNRVFGHTGSGDRGITLFSSATATGNIVHSNFNGIYAETAGAITGNRLYNNSNDAITMLGSSSPISGNHIYSNSVGIRTGIYAGSHRYSGRIENNLIYASADRGIILAGAQNAQIVNNTVYQPVGDAIQFSDATSSSVRNNIIYVGTGYGLRVETNAQTGFTSNRNIINQSNDPNASVGLWASVRRDSLTDWQSATAQDANSLAADPRFVDIDGADNILGYTPASGGIDGGTDDNFYLLFNSPAIDRASTAFAPTRDFESAAKQNDPATPDNGSLDYQIATNAPGTFLLTGVAQNWRSSGNAWNFTLPFSFPFYDTLTNQIRVYSDGYIDVGVTSGSVDNTNTSAELRAARRIAPLWTDLRTDLAGDDIFIDQTVPNQITLRWNASDQSDSSDVNFSVTLFSTGRIEFDYGAGNVVPSPTVGIGAGTGGAFETIPGYDTNPILTSANKVAFNAVGGFRDIGAIEFRGASNDIAPPAIVGTGPAGIFAGSTAAPFNQFTLITSEPINRIDAQASANYRLLGAGPDSVFGTLDDITYTLTPSYVDGSNTITLTVAAGQLPGGLYQLTVFSNDITSTGLHDLSGLLLDGDGNGSQGGAFVRNFAIVADGISPTVTAGAFSQFSSDQQISITFSEDVGATLDLSDVTLLNNTTSQIVASGLMLLSYNPATRTAVITFPGYPNGILPTGQYTLTLSAAGITDSAGNPLDGNANGTGGDNYVLSFAYQQGDIDGDGRVNFADLILLARNYGLNPATPAQGDLNYDGQINFLDLIELARNYNASILPATNDSGKPKQPPSSLADDILKLPNYIPGFSGFASNPKTSPSPNPNPKSKSPTDRR